MKDILKKLFIPNKILGFLIFNISMILLIVIFSMHLEDTPLAYIIYLSSTYSLIIFIIWFYKACEFSNDYIKRESKLYNWYQKNIKIITKVSITISLILNFIYGLLKLIAGIYYKSEWFITFAVYYLLLWFIKSSLMAHVKKHDFGVFLKKEYKKLKETGIILLVLNIVLSGMIILIIKQDQDIIYPGYIIYLVALYDFYLIITAFINVFKYRKKSSPVLISSKCINLTVAMISIISLETAMISEFGSGNHHFKLIMTSSTGLGVCLINSIMAVYMIIKAKKYLKNIDK